MVPLDRNEPYYAWDFGINNPRGGVTTLHVLAKEPDDDIGDSEIFVTMDPKNGGGYLYYDDQETAYDVVVSWANGTGPNGATLEPDPNGDVRVFPERATPTSEVLNEVRMVFTTKPANLGYAAPFSFKFLDPDNFIGLGKDDDDEFAWKGNDNYFVTPLSQPIGTIFKWTVPGNGPLPVSFTIDPAHAGDNWIVVSSASQARVAQTEMDDSSKANRYNVVTTAANGDDKLANKSDLLTVWRTLWVELDQMEVPDYRTGPNYDGFDPAKEYAGSLTDANGNPITGLWVTYQIANEPADFDLAFQPPKPDISLLTSAMLDACIVVKEIQQDSAYDSWRTNDLNNQWDTVTPFVHNVAEASTVGYSQQYRDVRIVSPTFWTIHAVGAYEYTTEKDGDKPNAEYTRGTAQLSVIFIYNETIRDISQSLGSQGIGEMNERKAVVLHEALHCFGVGHSTGGIMDSGYIMTAFGINWQTLLPIHIQGIQKVDMPYYAGGGE